MTTMVKYIKWHPSVGDIADFPIRWGEIYTYEDIVNLWFVVDALIGLGFYVGIHYDRNNNLVSVAVDTKWFMQR